MAFQRKIDNRKVEDREVENTPVRKKPKHRLGGHTLKTMAPERSGWYRRIIVDRPGRLEEAQEAGYTFVTDPKVKLGENPTEITQQDGQDSRVSKRVGTHADGTPMVGYLMEMPMDWYKENQQEKDNVIKAKEKQVATNKEGWTPEDQEKQYVPGKIRQ